MVFSAPIRLPVGIDTNGAFWMTEAIWFVRAPRSQWLISIQNCVAVVRFFSFLSSHLHVTSPFRLYSRPVPTSSMWRRLRAVWNSFVITILIFLYSHLLGSDNGLLLRERGDTLTRHSHTYVCIKLNCAEYFYFTPQYRERTHSIFMQFFFLIHSMPNYAFSCNYAKGEETCNHHRCVRHPYTQHCK